MSKVGICRAYLLLVSNQLPHCNSSHAMHWRMIAKSTQPSRAGDCVRLRKTSIRHTVTVRLFAQEAHISKLKEGVDAGGDASLQNGLDLAVSALKSVPPYGHREVCTCWHSYAKDVL